MVKIINPKKLKIYMLINFQNKEKIYQQKID